jgi:hypothetical protein
MKLRRHDNEVFSLSFLDCICCGFGAIILLLVLTGQLVRLQQELAELRGETDVLERELRGRIADLERQRARTARLTGDLTDVRGQFAATRGEAAVANIVETELVSAYQELTAEMERLLRQPPPRAPAQGSPVGGIPVDSEYVVFVIDTSNSMVKGLQVLNDQGRYMFEGQGGRWLEDTPATRRRIRDRMPDWRPYSESDPVPGIVQALRTYRAPDRRISLYVIGDEFTGNSMQAAADRIDAVNRADGTRPRARIHAIGFPEGPGYPPFTNIRFSSLMRTITSRNEGTFVGLTSEKPCRSYVEVLGTRRCVSN